MRHTILALIATTAFDVISPAAAQNYPVKPVAKVVRAANIRAE
jgi:hypothetical protein